MKSYKHIIFDIDGTMLDSSYADLTALQRVLREILHKEYDKEDLRFALGIPSDAALKQLEIEDTGTIIPLWNTYMNELGHTMQLFSGIREVIGELKSRGTKLGIITSKNKTEYKNDFIPFGLNSFFDTVICVEDSPTPKPTSAPMLAYLNKTETTPKEVLYIGDTIYDFQCAHNAGVDFGLVLWGNTPKEQINAQYRFNFPNEILYI